MKITVYEADWWVCICGNDPIQEGFYPCDATGKEVEPTPEAWTSGLYMCDRCGVLINCETHDIVGQRAQTA